MEQASLHVLQRNVVTIGKVENLQVKAEISQNIRP